MITNRDIIFISSIEWDFLWQIQQEIASRLAKAGNRVLYIENTGVRTPTSRDAKRIAARLRNNMRSIFSHSVREVSPNIHVVSPIVLPPFGAASQRFVNRRFLLPKIKRIAQRLGMRDPLLWSYLPTDTAVDLIEMLRTESGAIVYYCGADFSQLTPHVDALQQSEATLLKMADVVFTFCPQLIEYCGKWNSNVHRVPAGVDLELFHLGEIVEDEAGDSFLFYQEITLLMSFLPQPVIGYVGGMHRFVDYELLKESARARPQWSWVFVGAVQGKMDGLNELPNVHILGQQPHQHLAHYIRQFNVCLIPYLNNLTTATVLPLKLNEYLALGKPVVSTELPTIRDFNEQHKVLITADNQSSSFLRAIEEALNLPVDEKTMARRNEVAALGDWQTCLNDMSESIEAVLQKKILSTQS
ncbi:MAG TPA: glycosyltransferase [Pyrinomonadaceae bacterium]|nr:glycosyltransferase [Pyrinomonadaceae bacterium]